jgi:hypothetical protein
MPRYRSLVVSTWLITPPHALALTALRRQGYRSDKRYLVFQCLAHTNVGGGLPPPTFRSSFGSAQRLLMLHYSNRNDPPPSLIDGPLNHS